LLCGDIFKNIIFAASLIRKILLQLQITFTGRFLRLREKTALSTFLPFGTGRTWKWSLFRLLKKASRSREAYMKRIKTEK